MQVRRGKGLPCDSLPPTLCLPLTNSADPTFSYLGRFTVKLGKNEDLDYKLEMLKNAVAKLTVSDRGVLDLSLSVDHKAHFMPE